MSLGHVSLPTGPANYKEMRDFYVAILEPLGYKIYLEKDSHFLGLGAMAGPDFWLHCGGEDFPRITASEKPKGKTHVAFAVGSKKKVDDWYRNAVKAGGISNGKPGVREYSKDYYAAYVLDPLGNNIEAVYFSPLWLKALKAAPWVVTSLVGGLAGWVATLYLSKP